MKVFNPEKELRKIQHENKNKIIFGVIALLIIISIGSSYALYQVRYSKQIIYTKVAPFNIRDVILSVKVEGESTSRTSFPNQNEGYRFSGLECDKENTTTGSWNYDTWSLILDTKGSNKCTVFFKKYKLFSDVIKVDNTDIFNDDPGKNIRYAGADPNNYIWFNCNDYNGLNQTTASQKCEKWRIIGLFNNITKSDGKQENLVKIIRTGSIGIIPWNTANTNNWTTASLQNNLNKEYLIEGNDGSWITTSKDPNYKSITSNTLNMIETVNWNIGGYNGSSASWLAKDIYNAERGSIDGGSSPSTISWTGKIAIPYLSDIVYSMGGDNRSACLQSLPSGCGENNWPYNWEWHWTLTPNTNSSNSVLTATGTRGFSADAPHYGYQIQPSLYLKSSVKILDGIGSSTEPYILTPQ